MVVDGPADPAWRGRGGEGFSRPGARRGEGRDGRKGVLARDRTNPSAAPCPACGASARSGAAGSASRGRPASALLMSGRIVRVEYVGRKPNEPARRGNPRSRRLGTGPRWPFRAGVGFDAAPADRGASGASARRSALLRPGRVLPSLGRCRQRSSPTCRRSGGPSLARAVLPRSAAVRLASAGRLSGSPGCG